MRAATAGAPPRPPVAAAGALTIFVPALGILLSGFVYHKIVIIMIKNKRKSYSHIKWKYYETMESSTQVYSIIHTTDAVAFAALPLRRRPPDPPLGVAAPPPPAAATQMNLMEIITMRLVVLDSVEQF